MDQQIIRTGATRFGHFAPPLHLNAGRSWRLTLLLCLGHAVVMAGLVLARPDLLGISGVLVGSLSPYLALRLHAFRTAPDAVVALCIETNGGSTVRLRGGQSIPVRILGSTYLHPALCVVNLRSIPAADGKPVSHHVIIVADAVEAQAYRRLRVWLAWGWRSGSPAQSLHAR